MARILIIDDDEDQLENVVEWLILEEHSVETASNGKSGWAAINKGGYDLIILDWDMPDIQGIDILRRYRASGGTTPVIMLTGRDSIDHKAEGLDMGADDYLTKPFHMKELCARVRAAVRKDKNKPPIAKPLGTGNEELLKKADLLGTNLPSRYEFISQLGEGGVGLVFKARHPHLQKMVAIKMIHRTELREETATRFEQEAQVISKLEHPNIAAVYDFGLTERRQPYMVLEFVEGKNLFEYLNDVDHLSVADALDIAIQICEGIGHAHEAGIVHRDLKSSNIICKETGKDTTLVKILDFGCAKVRSMEASARPQHITKIGEIVGSPLYISPEQIQGGTIDEKCDIYALGCLLHELLTGVAPFVGKDEVETLLQHINADPLPLKRTRPDLSFPTGLDRILAKMLEKNPARRYQTMKEAQAELIAMKSKLQGSKDKWWDALLKFKKEQ
jgi:CheY-like chemotaxis protein/tRNA A-37 threonylcarbamoyl transferase component Bud32